MQNFDPRKQKRLGPAPIASFEKSFEDNQTHQDPEIENISSSAYETQTSLNTDKQKGINPETSNFGKSSSNIQPHEQKDLSTANPSPTIHAMETASSAINRNITKSSEINNSSNKTISPIKVSKKPPLLHSKDSIHDHPLRAPLQSLAPLTPRIDISRASSSSQHEDSRESSPENVFEQVGTGTLQEAVSLGFREDGALDLRTSTEELYFMDPEQKREEQEKMQQQQQQARKSPIIFKYDDQQLYLQQHQRKDSASSEVAALLCISGRTSRVSSVGSQGSAVSRLSAISAVSGVSRSPSPHRMLMETSFCGPKPLENVVESAANSVGQTAEILENVLLSRTKDLTQVVLAEGIKIESSPKKKTLPNQENLKKKIPAFDEISKIEEDKLNAKSTSNRKLLQRKGGTNERRDSTKKIVGVTPTGTEYIRINLKPDHLYADQGIAPHEKMIEIAGNETASADKPSTLKLTTDTEKSRNYSSPRQSRHTILPNEVKLGSDSRSPSPAIPGVSRKSSFCSLFKTKDSPDSPRDRSRSKSHERSSSHSQTGTPNKQKSVLAIFKPRRSGSKSKSSSPIEHETMSTLDGISQVEFKFNSEIQSANNQEISRPTSRLRYYDTPPDGTGIRIPLHTPPEEKETRKNLPGITQEAIIKQKEQLRPMSAPTTKITSDNVDNSSSNVRNIPTGDSVESVDIISKKVIAVVEHNKPSTVTEAKPLKNKQVESAKKIENLDAIHTLPDDVNQSERTWSLEVHHHSSQESQDTVLSENSANNSRRISKPSLDNVIESPVVENGITPKNINEQSFPKPITTTVTVQQSQQQKHIFHESKPQPLNNAPAMQSNGDAISKEKKRILFATRLGSGSQEQIFSTQFSLSKTESLSSQLSEQNSIPESPAETKDSLHRTDTVLRRPDDGKKKDSVEDLKKDALYKNSIVKNDSSTEEHGNSLRHSDSIEKRPSVILRRKDSSSEFRKRTEEDDYRHSKYFQNLDITKSIQSESKPNKVNRSDSESASVAHIDGNDEIIIADTKKPPSPASDILCPQPNVSDRLSVTSTDEPVDTSESEKDAEADPNRLKKHLSRHIGIIDDHESTGLVSQLSFEDELPYVPTTLPEERPQGISIIPVKERANMEVKTFSLDRPRSTTPMNPAHLEEFLEIVTPDSDGTHVPVRGEKLRISLPRKDSSAQNRQKKTTKSPRRISNASNKSWFEFAEQGIRGSITTTTSSTISGVITTPKDITQDHSSIERKNAYDNVRSHKDDKIASSPPPPLPPRKPSATSITSGQWINFENIPEKRKPPKRITALPKETVDNINKAGNVQYNYVKPEECQCECHDSERDPSHHQGSEITMPKGNNSISNVDLLKHSSGEDLQPLLDTDGRDGIYRSDSSQDDYGIDENQKRKNGKESANSRSSEYSDENESGERRIGSNRPSKHSS
ncbi:uncharacterized protein LOC129619273 [Condylostylus longicornis]|uniref:uncharacterized protein LOC129619273 n=1 Tax=Condylostylus longicornis TaxID=2530218 RepID=UPI00244D9B9B|nr:uncharacterized protein LOC129619273 [Condylostylus longicornis]